MAMQYDVKSTTIAAGNTGTAVSSPRARLKAITINAISTTAGTVTITDGNGGVTLFSSLTPAVTGVTHILIPGEGILAQNNLYVVTGAGASAIIFYG
jgi:hypothetical protein